MWSGRGNKDLVALPVKKQASWFWFFWVCCWLGFFGLGFFFFSLVLPPLLHFAAKKKPHSFIGFFLHCICNSLSRTLAYLVSQLVHDDKTCEDFCLQIWQIQITETRRITCITFSLILLPTQNRQIYWIYT